MFELAERNRNLGQFLAAKVINPGQNESQQMFALWPGERDSSPKESPDTGRKIEAKWLARTLRQKWHLFPSAEIGVKNISFEKRCRGEQMGQISCQTPGEEAERILDKKNLYLQAI